MATDLNGQKFGRLLVIKSNVEKIGLNYKCLCLCDCGKEVLLYKSTLKNGHTKSCGCLRNEMSSKRLKTHGLTKSSIHIVWVNMIQRCTNENNYQYKNYGGRGINVCERWLRFIDFYNDMIYGYNIDLELDRIDNNKGYYKENCRWATTKINSRNKRNTKLDLHKIDEIRKSGLRVSVLAKMYSVHPNHIYKILNYERWNS